MRTVLAGLLSVLLLAVALAGPVAAAKPVGGCPNPKFTLMDYQAFRALSVSVGVPESLLGPEHLALWQSIDQNSDDMLCVMDLPDTPGTGGGWLFNLTDNTARR